MNRASAILNMKRTEQGRNSPVTLEAVARTLGMDRKTLAARLRNPPDFRGYELALLYRFLKFTETERAEFTNEALKILGIQKGEA